MDYDSDSDSESDEELEDKHEDSTIEQQDDLFAEVPKRS